MTIHQRGGAGVALPVVRDIMSRAVAPVRTGAGYREIIDAMVEHDVAMLPVVDAEGRVVGVVSDADIVSMMASGEPPPRWYSSRPAECGEAPVTIAPDASIATAARLMDATDIERLTVVDADRRPVGSVSRRDILKAFARADSTVRDELAGPVLRRVLALQAPTVRVESVNGVVTLTGTTTRRSTAQLAVGLARSVPGVVDVVDHLAYEHDDTAQPLRRADARV